MGIQATWALLETAAQPINAKGGALSGMRIGVDMSVLLHAAYASESIALAMVIDRDPAPKAAVALVRQQLERLRTFKAIPIAYFDGKSSLAKAKENAARGAARNDAVREARDAVGRNAKQAAAAAKKAASTTPELRRDVVDCCRQLGVAVVGAPREADGQLAWDFRAGQLDYVYTTDSDLVALGCCVLRPADPKHPIVVPVGSFRLYPRPAAVGPPVAAAAPFTLPTAERRPRDRTSSACVPTD